MIGLTEHAVDQYQRRIRPDLSLALCEKRLVLLLQQAKIGKKKTNRGDSRLILEDCQAIIGWTKDRGTIVKTIYPPKPTDQGWDSIIRELADECQAALNDPPNKPNSIVAIIEATPEPVDLKYRPKLEKAIDLETTLLTLRAAPKTLTRLTYERDQFEGQLRANKRRLETLQERNASLTATVQRLLALVPLDEATMEALGDCAWVLKKGEV